MHKRNTLTAVLLLLCVLFSAVFSLQAVGVTYAQSDTDQDGIEDSQDDCPTVPGSSQFNGCPDSDQDGVPEPRDQCPNQPGTINNNGCPEQPADRDQDGVPDSQDQCPDKPGPSSNNGCPIIIATATPTPGAAPLPGNQTGGGAGGGIVITPTPITVVPTTAIRRPVTSINPDGSCAAASYGGRVNVRAEPNATARILGTLDDTKVYLIDAAQADPGDPTVTWYRVTSFNGWVSSAAVFTGGNCPFGQGAAAPTDTPTATGTIAAAAPVVCSLTAVSGQVSIYDEPYGESNGILDNGSTVEFSQRFYNGDTGENFFRLADGSGWIKLTADVRLESGCNWSAQRNAAFGAFAGQGQCVAQSSPELEIRLYDLPVPLGGVEVDTISFEVVQLSGVSLIKQGESATTWGQIAESGLWIANPYTNIDCPASLVVVSLPTAPTSTPADDDRDDDSDGGSSDGSDGDADDDPPTSAIAVVTPPVPAFTIGGSSGLKGGFDPNGAFVTRLDIDNDGQPDDDLKIAQIPIGKNALLIISRDTATGNVLSAELSVVNPASQIGVSIPLKNALYNENEGLVLCPPTAASALDCALALPIPLLRTADQTLIDRLAAFGEQEIFELRIRGTSAALFDNRAFVTGGLVRAINLYDLCVTVLDGTVTCIPVEPPINASQSTIAAPDLQTCTLKADGSVQCPNRVNDTVAVQSTPTAGDDQTNISAREFVNCGSDGELVLSSCDQTNTTVQQSPTMQIRAATNRSDDGISFEVQYERGEDGSFRASVQRVRES